MATDFIYDPLTLQLNPPLVKTGGVTITELKEGEESSLDSRVNGHIHPLPTTTPSADAPMTSLDKVKFYEKLGFDQNLVPFLSEIVEDASKVVEQRVGEVVDGSKTIEGFQPPKRIIEKSVVVDAEDVTLNLTKDDGASGGRGAQNSSSGKGETRLHGGRTSPHEAGAAGGRAASPVRGR